MAGRQAASQQQQQRKQQTQVSLKSIRYISSGTDNRAATEKTFKSKRFSEIYLDGKCEANKKSREEKERQRKWRKTAQDCGGYGPQMGGRGQGLVAA